MDLTVEEQVAGVGRADRKGSRCANGHASLLLTGLASRAGLKIETLECEVCGRRHSRIEIPQRKAA